MERNIERVNDVPGIAEGCVKSVTKKVFDIYWSTKKMYEFCLNQDEYLEELLDKEDEDPEFSADDVIIERYKEFFTLGAVSILPLRDDVQTCALTGFDIINKMDTVASQYSTLLQINERLSVGLYPEDEVLSFLTKRLKSMYEISAFALSRAALLPIFLYSKTECKISAPYISILGEELGLSGIEAIQQFSEEVVKDYFNKVDITYLEKDLNLRKDFYSIIGEDSGLIFTNEELNKMSEEELISSEIKTRFLEVESYITKENVDNILSGKRTPYEVYCDIVSCI